MPAQVYDRVHFQKRVREELARSQRYDREFCLLIFAAHLGVHPLPFAKRMFAAGEVLKRSLRTSDVVCPVFDDTLSALLVETGVDGTHDLMIRLGARIQLAAGAFAVSALFFPEQRQAIEHHEVLLAV